MLAALLLSAIPAWGQDPEPPKEPRKLKGTLQVTIDSRGDIFSPVFVVLGVLSAQFESAGSFTGELTPGVDRDGKPLTSVLFVGRNLVPDPNVKSLKVSGQANGRALSLTVEMGENSFLFCTGSSRNDLDKMTEGVMTGSAGGPAVTTLVGDRGSWSFGAPPKTE